MDRCLSRCETLHGEVAHAVGEQEKLKASKCLLEHIEEAQQERDYYRRRTVEARDELQALARPASPPVRPCSVKLQKVHYTFDFAQNVSLPHTARQVGPLLFKTPRKVQIFGVNCEGKPKQINYQLDEADTIGQDCKKSHGANTVVFL